MFCPQCGTNQAEDSKFCKSCGANLSAVKKAFISRDTQERFDAAILKARSSPFWSKGVVAKMLTAQEERESEQARKQSLERGEEAAIKRYNEIKAGVITTCVGAGVMFFLHTLFQGIIASGDVPRDAAAILRVLWAAGVIPFVVGIGVAFNGLVVSRKQVEIVRRALPPTSSPKMVAPAPNTADQSLATSEWLEPPEFGVTENTTRELR
jgi:hypothetical protein